jgi:glyoxylase-like metal-dependent hydrolase (beta-lactamase superfamily II)
MKPKIHTYTSIEPMLRVNAFIIEAAKELVIVDTTLTNSDSLALKKLAASLDKPIAAILLTHGHPDHVAGAANLVSDATIPVYALPSVKKLMQDTEAKKHAQWSGMFGDEWIRQWTYPDHLVNDGDTVKLAGLNFQVVDIGAGGDCDANSFWLLNDETRAAFVGDFIYHENHTYMADGNILRWLSNLEKYNDLLKQYDQYYVGHGSVCNFSALQKQKEYFLTYCGEVLAHTHGTGTFSNESKDAFIKTMTNRYPNYGCQFMIGLAAEVVGRELAEK